MPSSLSSPLTQNQWEDKLRDWIPLWYFENELVQVAHIKAVAYVLSQSDNDAFEHVKQTFIKYAEGDALTQIGLDRGILRLPNELDAQYRIRVRRITNNSDCLSLKDLIDSILLVGESRILEDYNSTIFLDRNHFLDRGEIFIDIIENVFSIIVSKQVSAPNYFYDRNNFLDRSDFFGTTISSSYVFDLIKRIVDDNKAKGTLYRVIEKIEG